MQEELHERRSRGLVSERNQDRMKKIVFMQNENGVRNGLGNRGRIYGEVERGTRTRTNEANKRVQVQQEVRQGCNAMVSAIFRKEMKEGIS